MNRVLILILLLSTFSALAAEVSLSCKLIQKSAFTRTVRDVLELTTLSDSSSSSVAIKPSMSLDSSALYLLSLSLGEDYTDVDGEIIGSDYFLSLVRVGTSPSQASMAKIRGTTQKIMKIEAFEGRRTSFSLPKEPKHIDLSYSIGQKKIKLICDIVSLR